MVIVCNHRAAEVDGFAVETVFIPAYVVATTAVDGSSDRAGSPSSTH
jgi:hypothetical protein